MAKVKVKYRCGECGAETAQFFGKCPACHAWNSLVEEVIPTTTTITDGTRLVAARSHANKRSPQTRTAQTLAELSDAPFDRFSAGYGELDRVLGGGIVPGSLVLVGGDPGIGKSTLLLQMMNYLGQHYRVLYVCAEESGQQVKLRAERLGVGAMTPDPPVQPVTDQADLYLLPETDLEAVLRELETLQPQVAVIDSIQAMYLAALASAPGSVAQVRECTAALMRVAKRDHITLFVVGHVTKEGAIAGPKVLEHLVDTVLYFEGDRFASHRLLRSVKNRFGATHEIGVFEMRDRGLSESPIHRHCFWEIGMRSPLAQR
jgi:DNA repair protein RadA/Sms